MASHSSPATVVPAARRFKHPWLIVAAVIVSQAAILYSMGRLVMCGCGYVRLWHGVVFSAENSQHLSDWYSFSHVIHGVLFYGLFALAARKQPASLRLALALGLEAAWEVIENTPPVIDRYRAVTISLGYYGDTIVNSISDTLFCAAGFALARVLPVKATIVLAVAIELALLYFIHDSLALNVIMLIWPLDAIRTWQQGIGL
jgi:Protein of unknown function (DUF2585)